MPFEHRVKQDSCLSCTAARLRHPHDLQKDQCTASNQFRRWQCSMGLICMPHVLAFQTAVSWSQQKQASNSGLPWEPAPRSPGHHSSRANFHRRNDSQCRPCNASMTELFALWDFSCGCGRSTSDEVVQQPGSPGETKFQSSASSTPLPSRLGRAAPEANSPLLLGIS